MRNVRHALAPWTGLVVGASAWAACVQAGQLLPYVDCARGSVWTASACLVAAIAAIAGALLSWLTAARDRESRVRTFVARINMIGGALFAFALALQLAASLLLPACDR